MRIKWGDLKPSDRIALVGLIITAISVAIAFVQLFDPFSSGAGPPTTTAATSQHDPIAVNVKQLSQLDVCNGGNGSIYSQPIAALSDYERLIDEVYVKAIDQNLDWATSEQRHDEWAARHGGIPANVTHVTISVQAKSDAAVLLTGLKFQVIRTAPVTGTHLIPPGECGGGQDVRKFAVNLDERDPTARPIPAMWASEADQKYVTNFPYKVSHADPEYIELVVYTIENDCTWTATLKWVADGQAGKTEIKNGGAPFRLSSSKNSGAWEYDLATNRVERTPARDWTGRPPEEVKLG
jgi:hypothetical protein